MARLEDSSLTPVVLIAATALLFVLIGGLIWFAMPGADARHHFASPSGRMVLDLVEHCGEAPCRRTATAETIAPDGSRTRRGCTLPLAADHPVLLNAYPLWADDEQTVVLVYADAEGMGGKFTLDFARDCTAPE